ncbi:MAG: ferritin family protein [Candidatus Thermoplasmatota archaeon]
MLTTDLTALEVLGVAVRREMDTARTYPDLASRCTSPLARDRFQLLVQESRQHEALLRARHADLAPGVAVAVPPPLASAPQAAGGSDAGEGLRGALRYAADAERRSREFYLDAAATAADLTGHNMFRYLADAHARHHAELEAEYDLILRYPHAYDDPQAPWRPEGRTRKE